MFSIHNGTGSRVAQGYGTVRAFLLTETTS